MVKDLFDSLLDEVSQAMEIPDLHADHNNTCLIHLANGLNVQLEVEPRSQSLVMGSDLGEVPIGRYRQTIFGEALKANGAPGPHAGILAYSNKSDHLVLFKMIPLKELNGEKIAQSLKLFAEYGVLWKEAVERGEVPVHGQVPSTGMFGLRP